MDLRSIEVFLAICDQGGFTAAAQSLGLTQAAVSQQITRLERELGVALIDRTVRPQKLTAAGEHLQRRGTTLLNNLRLVKSELTHYQLYDIPKLRLALIESVAGSMLPLILAKLKGKVGTLSITSGTTHPLMPELRAGNFDLLITSEQIGEQDVLMSECLLVEPIVLVLPKGHRVPRDWSELSEIAQTLDLVRYGDRRRIGRMVNHLLERHDLQPRGTLSFDSSAAVLDCVRSGAAWAASTPMCLLSSGAEPGDFEIATFPHAVPVRSLNAVWRKEADGVEIRSAVRMIRAVLEEDIYPALTHKYETVRDRIHLPDEDAPVANESASD